MAFAQEWGRRSLADGAFADRARRMMLNLSPNTQAILMLTAPLIAGRNPVTPDILSPSEYKRLARHLREIQKQPADLVSTDAAEVIRACISVIEEGRLHRLLARGFLLSQAYERWQTRAIWVVSRADSEYPARLKERLRENAPAVLYGCGDRHLLEYGGLAVVGSRHVDDALVDYTLLIGQTAARAGRMLVSGGAKGIDQAAMRGALEAGGRACGVLADSLERTAMNRENRNLLLDGQLVLISPYDPGAGFNVGNAMQRNKLVYALSDAALVVSSDLDKGGTWAGAVEQLDKLHLVPVYVRSAREGSPGLDALQKKGALVWPEPQDAEGLDAVFNPPLSTLIQPGLTLPEGKAQEPVGQTVAENPPAAELTSDVATSPSELLFVAVRRAMQELLKTPMKDSEIAAELNVTPAQTKAWLQRLVDEDVVQRSKKPVGYVVKQPNLFG